MNTNLLNIVKQIVAEKGENILADSQKLKPLFSDYAKDEPKNERIAFGRCIEMGAYKELKNTSTPEERKRKKAALADQLNATAGIDKTQCMNALDLLEAAIFTSAQPTSRPQVSSQSASPSSRQEFSQLPSSTPSKRLSGRTIIFGIAGALGGGIGTFVSDFFIKYNYQSNMQLIFSTAAWAAFIGVGISLGLLAAQSLYLKKNPEIPSIIKTVFIGLVMGAVSGGIAQFIFGSIGSETSQVVREIIRAGCWGILGLGVGLGVSMFVPNYPKQRAVIAGFLGGVIGGIFFIILSYNISDAAGRFVGLAILGFFIGLTISVVEEALRQAWLTIIWGPKETRTISLGQKPIIFGSSTEADIFLPKDKEPAVRATVQIENSKVIMVDKTTNQRKVLQNGEQVSFGKISFVVNTKS